MTIPSTVPLDEGALATGGYNCAQKVLGAYAGRYGLEPQQALRVMAGFGGGLYTGEVCGAASGGVAVVGLKYGQTRPGDAETKRVCTQKVQEFMRAFKDRCNGVLCRELIKAEGKRVCPRLIQCAVEILQEQGY